MPQHRQRHRPTVRDVAAQAGVSAATVSRVLSGGRPVAASVRARVLDAADRLGHPSAQGPAGRGHLAVVLDDAESPYCYAVVPELAAAARREGWSVSVLAAGADPTPSTALRVAVDLGAEVVVLTDVVHAGLPPDAQERLRRDGPRVVVLGEPVPGHDAVVVDDEAAGALLATTTARPGWRRVVVLAGPEDDRALARRAAGLTGELARRSGVEVVVLHGPPNRTAPSAALAAALDDGPVDAVLAVTDHLALGARKEVLGRGRLDEDVTVAGVDGLAIGREASPPLVSVEVPYRDVAAALWRLASVARTEPETVRVAAPSLGPAETPRTCGRPTVARTRDDAHDRSG